MSRKERPRGSPDEERRKVFRRMAFVFVWAPPLLILFLAASMALLFAAIFPFGGVGYWTSWVFWAVLIVAVPGLAYLAWQAVKKPEE